jgi:hypothetical protein
MQPPGPGPSPTDALTAHIATIQDQAALDHPGIIYVHPGDVVRLSAEGFHYGAALRESPDKFSWSAPGAPTCNVAIAQSCVGSGFLADNFGVDYVVPAAMTSDIPLTLSLTGQNATGDSIVLRSLGTDFTKSDPRFHSFPRWNPDWDKDRAGSWNQTWDRNYQGNRPKGETGEVVRGPRGHHRHHG